MLFIVFCCLFFYVLGCVTVAAVCWWLLVDQSKNVTKEEEKVKITKPVLPDTLRENLKNLNEDGQGPFKEETCIAFNYIMQFFFQEKNYDSAFVQWAYDVISIEITELLNHRALSKVIRNMEIKDMNLGTNFPVIESITPKKVIVNPETDLIDLIELSVDFNYCGGCVLAIDATTKFNSSAMLQVKIVKIAGKARLQFSRNPYTYWSFSFYEEPQSIFEVESSVLGRQIPRFKTIIANQLKAVLRKKHTLPYFKMRSKPLVPPGPITAAAMLAVGRSVPTLRIPQFTAADGCTIPCGSLLVTVESCSRLQKELLCGSIYCSVILCDTPIICSWEVNSDQLSYGEGPHEMWVVMELYAKRKSSGSPSGVLLRTGSDNLQVVESVNPHSPAGLAGIRAGDVILSVNGIKITSAAKGAKLLTVNASKTNTVKGTTTSTSTSTSVGKSSSGNLQQFDDALESSFPASAGGGMTIRIRRKVLGSDSQREETTTAAYKSEHSENQPQPTLLPSDSKDSVFVPTDKDGSAPEKESLLVGDVSDVRLRRVKQQDESKRSCSSDRAISSPDSLSVTQSSLNRGSHNSMTDLTQQATANTLTKHASSPSLNTVVESEGSKEESERSGEVLERRGHTKAKTLIVRAKNTSAVPVSQNPSFDPFGLEYLIDEEVKFLTVCVWSKGHQQSVTERGAEAAKDNKEEKENETRKKTTGSKGSRLKKDSFGSRDGAKSRSLSGLETVHHLTGQPPDTLLGYSVVPLVSLVPESRLNTRGHIVKVLPLQSGDTCPSLSENIKLRNLKGYEPSLCYGDVMLSMIYKERARDTKSFFLNSDEDNNQNSDTDDEPSLAMSVVSSCSEAAAGGALRGNERSEHDFKRTHFHSATVCDFCHKKIWLKDAYECKSCGITCHKKCVAKCSSETVCSAFKPDTMDNKSLDSAIALSDDSAHTPPEIVMTKPGEEMRKNTDSPRSHRRALSNIISIVKNSGPMKRTGSASNLPEAVSKNECVEAVAHNSVSSVLSLASLTAFDEAIQRTESADNLLTKVEEKKSKRERFREMIAGKREHLNSESKSSSVDLLPSKSSKSINPSHLFRSNKKQCKSKASNEEDELSLRKSPTVSSPRSHSSPSRNVLSANDLVLDFTMKKTLEKSKSLPPSPTLSPKSMKVEVNPFSLFTTDSDHCIHRTLRQLMRCHLQDERLLTLARDSAHTLLADVVAKERKPRIAGALEKVQSLVDKEEEHRIDLARREKEALKTSDTNARTRIMADISVCDSRKQALALLTMYLFTALHLCHDTIQQEKKMEGDNRQSNQRKSQTDVTNGQVVGSLDERLL